MLDKVVLRCSGPGALRTIGKPGLNHHSQVLWVVPRPDLPNSDEDRSSSLQTSFGSDERFVQRMNLRPNFAGIEYSFGHFVTQ